MSLSNRLAAPDYYDCDAETFAARYDSVSFEAVHPLLSLYLPSTGPALDVGAGSGRDARALALRGLTVTAVEPSGGLRTIGEANTVGVRWVDDQLPSLATVTAMGEPFDFILCSAVLMLVNPTDLLPSFKTLAFLLSANGRLALNLRAPRPDEPTNLFFDHSDAVVLGSAVAANLTCVDRGIASDAMGRTSYSWRSFVFEQAHS